MLYSPGEEGVGENLLRIFVLQLSHYISICLGCLDLYGIWRLFWNKYCLFEYANDRHPAHPLATPLPPNCWHHGQVRGLSKLIRGQEVYKLYMEGKGDQPLQIRRVFESYRTSTCPV